jgi:hypothetical protein
MIYHMFLANVKMIGIRECLHMTVVFNIVAAGPAPQAASAVFVSNDTANSPPVNNLGSTPGSFDYIRVLESDGNVCTGRPEECGNPAPITDVNNVQLDIAMPDGSTCYGTVAECLSEYALDPFDTKTRERSGAKALLAN